jgi:hypothetical protein
VSPQKHLTQADRQKHPGQKEKVGNFEAKGWIYSATLGTDFGSHSSGTFIQIMQHARRMILVPDDQQQQSENIPNPPAPVSSFRNIDTDIENVLSKKNISDFEKIALYNSILNKYLIKFHAQKDNERAARDQHNEDIEERGVSDSKTEQAAEEASNDTNFNIVKNILQQSATVTWDDKGKVFVNGEPTGSAINSLVTHLISQNEFKTLPGWSIFLEAVKKLNIPKAYTPALSRKRKLIEDENIEHKVRKIDPGLKRKNTEFDFPIKHQKTVNSKASVVKRKVADLDTNNKRASSASLKGKKRQIAEGSAESEKKRQKVASQATKRKSSDKLDKTIAKRSKTANKLKRHIEDDTENLANKRIKLALKKRGIASEEKPGGKRRKIEATEKKVKKAAKKNDKSGKKIKWLGYK